MLSVFAYRLWPLAREFGLVRNDRLYEFEMFRIDCYVESIAIKLPVDKFVMVIELHDEYRRSTSICLGVQKQRQFSR